MCVILLNPFRNCMYRKWWGALHQTPGCDQDSCKRLTRRVHDLWIRTRTVLTALTGKEAIRGSCGLTHIHTHTHAAPTATFPSLAENKLQNVFIYENVRNVWKKRNKLSWITSWRPAQCPQLRLVRAGHTRWCCQKGSPLPSAIGVGKRNSNLPTPSKWP